MRKRVVIVGGGAAGLMAAISAAENGADVLVLEKMPAPGRKILITGKGRCNFTNRCEITDFPKFFPNNGAFLYSALRAFDNQDLIDFLAAHGVPSKVERGGRLFPVSDKAVDVVGTRQAPKAVGAVAGGHRRCHRGPVGQRAGHVECAEPAPMRN